MSWVWIDSEYRETLGRQGLLAAADFLRLPGLILWGHPDRHVLKSTLADQGVFLKKEHRVPWRDRLANAWAGFGFVSKSAREAQVLQAVRQSGLSCPRVLAHGAARGQAFLLLGEEPGVSDLRLFLRAHPDQAAAVARALGTEVGRMHAAGFEHGDLYAKHVLIGPGPRLCLVDWQRARRRPALSWACRSRDLSTLDATLLETLASARVRLAFLRSYRKTYTHCAGTGAALTVGGFAAAAHAIRRLSLQLLRKRRVRELRCVPLPPGTQSLVWLDGEALCVTGSFREEIGPQVPDWLRFRVTKPNTLESARIFLANDRTANLVRRSVAGLGQWLVSWWRKSQAPEIAQAALLFRLERHGVPSPRLLAFGERRLALGRRHSFLLTEVPQAQGSLHNYLAHSTSTIWRGMLLRQAGALLRGLHEAGYRMGNAQCFAANLALDEEERLTLAHRGCAPSAATMACARCARLASSGGELWVAPH